MADVYLAGSYADRERIAREVLPQYLRAGLTASATWAFGVHDAAGVSRQVAGIHDLEEINAARVVVVDCLGSPSTGGGRWFEAGYALGRGKPFVIVGDAEIVFRDQAKLVVESHKQACATLYGLLDRQG